MLDPELSELSWSKCAGTADFLLHSVVGLSEAGNVLFDLSSVSSKGVFYPLRLGVVILLQPLVWVGPLTSVMPGSPIFGRPSSMGASQMTSSFLWWPFVAFSPRAYVSPIVLWKSSRSVQAFVVSDVFPTRPNVGSFRKTWLVDKTRSIVPWPVIGKGFVL